MRGSQLNVSLHALPFFTSLACICAPEMALRVIPPGLQWKRNERKKYYRISYINRSLISNTDFQMHNLEWVITLSRLLHPDLKYWWKGVIAIPITHVQMRHFTCPVKWSISIQQKNIVEVLQGNVAEKIGLSLAESYFSPLPNEAIHITLHRFKLTWNWTKTAKVLARALFCWPYCKQQCPVGQPVRNSL